MTLGAIVISFIGGYYIAMPCDKINFTLGSSQKTLQWYPDCSPYFTQGDISRKVVVDADVFGPDPLQTAAAFNLTYGAGAWLAFFFHVVGSELYVSSFPLYSISLTLTHKADPVYWGGDGTGKSYS